jgi:Ca-activated chloride channel family protein
MHGFPLDTAKALMNDLLGRLGPQDLLNVVLFAGSSQVLAPAGSLPANPANVQSAVALLGAQQGGGGTELLAALRAAYGIPRRDRGVARTVVVVTDGYVAVEAEAYRFVRERLAEANMFSFGIGSAVNRHLVEGLARAGQGEPFVVLSPDRAGEAARKFREYVERPVLTGIAVSFEGLDAREVLPSRVPDLFAERPVVVVGQYRGKARGRVVLTGTTGAGRWRASVDIGPEAASGEHGALRTLWARRWVDMLQDDLALSPARELEDAITDIGLSHALLTRFTSFVAIDSEVVNRGGKPAEVEQPLPLPRGVSDLAVGAAAPAQLSSAKVLQRRAEAPYPAAPERDATKGGAPAAEVRKDAARDRAQSAAEAQPQATDEKRPVTTYVLRATSPDGEKDGGAIARAVTAKLEALHVASGRALECGSRSTGKAASRAWRCSRRRTPACGRSSSRGSRGWSSARHERAPPS